MESFSQFVAHIKHRIEVKFFHSENSLHFFFLYFVAAFFGDIAVLMFVFNLKKIFRGVDGYSLSSRVPPTARLPSSDDRVCCCDLFYFIHLIQLSIF